MKQFWTNSIRNKLLRHQHNKSRLTRTTYNPLTVPLTDPYKKACSQTYALKLERKRKTVELMGKAYVRKLAGKSQIEEHTVKACTRKASHKH